MGLIKNETMKNILILTMGENILTLSSLLTNTDFFANSADPYGTTVTLQTVQLQMGWLVRSHHTSTYTVSILLLISD